jgi:hypothetical protein
MLTRLAPDDTGVIRVRESASRFHRQPLFAVIITLLVVMGLFSTPMRVGATPEEAGPAITPGENVLPEIAVQRPYYCPQVARSFCGDAAPADERFSETVPAELLPESLTPSGAVETGGIPGVAPESDIGSGGGTGGWRELSRAYTPSANPDINYWPDTMWSQVDGNGNMHFFYDRAVMTDISQPPDPAGTALEPLQDSLYTMYSEGRWLSPLNLTNVSGYGDSEIHLFQVDDDNRTHVVYSKWTWGRDPTFGVYQHEDENMYYRYLSPGGAWSAPRRLTDFSGPWGFLSADFAMKNGSVYGTFIAILNRETVPSSYRARVGFLEGLTGAWERPTTLTQWDFNNDPGQLQPQYWPSIDASDVGAEVSITYEVKTTSPILADARSDIHAFHRNEHRAWSGPDKLTSAGANQFWRPLWVFYRAGSRVATVMALRMPQVVDATHPIHMNFYFIYHNAVGWTAPKNVTRAPAGGQGFPLAMSLDPFGRMHLIYTVIRNSWAGGAWTPQGASASYTRETSSGMSEPQTLLAYQANRFIGDGGIALDQDGGISAFVAGFRRTGGGDFTDFSLYHSYSAPSGSGGAFGTPTTIRGPVANDISHVTASNLSDNRALVSWLETRFDAGTGEPLTGVIYSRAWNDSSWGPRETVSSVPGNSDMVHSSAGGWPAYLASTVGDNGEQQWVFETAGYNPGTGTYYGFRKYHAETLNGTWSSPDLISGRDVEGQYPEILVDNNGRLFVLFSSINAATGQEVVYATNQLEATTPSTTYYFAEGTTRSGFEEWISIQNPNDGEVAVNITYMLENGETVSNDMKVGAHSRSTVSVNDAVGPDRDVSARVQADNLIMAERPMYFDFHGWPGGHDAIGATSPSRTWYFAEGTTRSGFAEYLTLQNPSGRTADVEVTYVLGDGSIITETVEVGPTTRATVDVNAAVGPGQDVSLVVSCDDVAIVAERPMYFDYHGWCTGGHDVMGSTSLDTLWYFAEGTTRAGFDTYLSIQNPFEVNSEVHFDFVLGDGSVVDHDMNVGSTSRQTLNVNDVVGEEKDVSAVVTSSSPILVERPMYFLYRDKWTGGHVAMGARELKNAWFFAEGTTRDGFEEWLSLENPSDTDTVARIDYMLEDGTVIETDVGVPAHTRVTVDVPLAVGPGRDISVAIWSDIGIIAERPMYFDYHGMWQGGHDVVGL